MPKDYRLIIDPPRNGPKDASKEDKSIYRAQWLLPEAGQSIPFDFTPPLQKEHLEELRWYLEEFIQFPGAGDRVRAGKLEKNLMEWGRMLFDAAFAGDEGKRIAGSLMDDAPGSRHGAQNGGSAGNNKGATLTIASTDATILSQPWELLRDASPRNDHEPLALRGVTIRRQLRETKSLPRYEFQSPLRILLIVARPKDAGFIDPRNSIPPILDAAESLPGLVEVDFCEPPTLTELERRLGATTQSGKPYHIVHFDGHGTMMEFEDHGPHQPVREAGVLCFENDESKLDPVIGLILGKLLSEHHVSVVILESCRGAYLSDQPAYTSVAPALLQSGVGSVVAFSHTVHVEAARILVARFYAELVAGASVGAAVDQARAALSEHPQRWLSRGPDAETIHIADWFIPQLYQAGDDPVLLRDGKKDAGTRKDAQSSLRTPRFELHPSFPPPPKYYFQGRARELLQLERAFRQHPAVLLHAMGGMGKTALAREAAHWWRRKGTIQTAVFHSFEYLAGAERVVQVLGQALTGGQGGDAGGEAFSAEFDSLASDEQWRRAVALFHQQPVLLVWDNFESTLAQFAEQPGIAVGWGERSEPQQDDAGESIAGESALGFASLTPTYKANTNTDPITGFSPESREDLLRLYDDLTTPKNGHPPRGLLLITCRPGETFLPVPEEAKVELEGLHPADALYLLRAVMQQKRMDPERHERFEIDALLKMLAWQPLSIELVTPHLAELTPQQIRDEFAEHLGRFTNPNQPEERNRSLLASLEFSVGRLSPAARKVLPWLSWFRGGVFERFLLAFTKQGPADWAPIRAELAATALIRVEEVPGFTTPYLRFHPTLAFYAAGSRMPIREANRIGGVAGDERSEPPEAVGWAKARPSAAVLPQTESAVPIMDADAPMGTAPEADTSGAFAHPTQDHDDLITGFPFDAREDSVQSTDAARAAELGERFLAVYLRVMGAIDDMLRGRQPAAGMALAGREEANLRRALALAFQGGKHQEGWQIADTLGLYLERAGRRRERNALAAWVRGRLPDAESGELDEATCAAIQDHAWGLFQQGRGQEALEQVEGLLARLQRSDGTLFQIAMTQSTLGRIYLHAGRSALALAPLGAAIVGFEALGEEQRDNLAVALGDLANAYLNLGRLDEGLAMAERGLSIDREMGNNRNIAVDLNRTAAILKDAQRYTEAEQRYQAALAAARRVGDRELEGAFLQHLGVLHHEQGRYPEARRHLQQAMSQFQAAGEQEGEMQCGDLLASVEQQQGRLDEAEGWYLRARELAGQRRDHKHLAINAHNLGILYQIRAEQASDPAARAAWLEKALASVREGLDGFLAMGDQLHAAASYHQLGILYGLSGELKAAEENARLELAISESRDHPEVYKDYHLLMEIARARGDEKAARQWQKKRDAKMVELERLRRGN